MKYKSSNNKHKITYGHHNKHHEIQLLLETKLKKGVSGVNRLNKTKKNTNKLVKDFATHKRQRNPQHLPTNSNNL